MDKSKVDEFKRRIYDHNTSFIYVNGEEKLTYLMHQLDYETNRILIIKFNKESLDWDSVIIPIAKSILNCITKTKRRTKKLDAYFNYLLNIKNQKDNLTRSHVENILELIDKIPIETKEDLIIIFTNFQHVLNMKTSFYYPEGVLRGIFQHFSDKVSLNLILNSQEALFNICGDNKKPFYRGGPIYICE